MRGLKYFFLAMIAVAGLLLGGCGDDDNNIIVVPAYNGKFLYVNNDAATNVVSAFAIQGNGTLEHLPGSPFLTGGAGAGGGFYAANPIAIAKSKNLLFAANKLDSTITSFTINPGTGELTRVGLPVASGGTMGESGSLAVDPESKFLFAANDLVNSISVFSIATNGALTPVLGSPFLLGVGFDADGITLNALGNILYVAAPTANVLAVLNVDANGALTHIAGSPFANAAGGNITSFVRNTANRGLSGATTGVLASYSIDNIGAPTLIDSLLLGGNIQAIATGRGGGLAILAGGGNGAISMVQVAADGLLTPVIGSPFATAGPTSGYAIANPSGAHLYATEVDQIEAFVISKDGALASINTYPLANPGYATGLVIY